MRPFADGLGVELDELLGEGDPALGEFAPVPMHDERAEGDEEHGESSGGSVADVEVDAGLTRGGEVAGLLLAAKHPEGGPGGEVDGGGHPPEQADEKGECWPAGRGSVRLKVGDRRSGWLGMAIETAARVPKASMR